MKTLQSGYTLLEVLMWLVIGMSLLILAEQILETWIHQERNLENSLSQGSDSLLLENVLRRAFASAGLDEYGEVSSLGHHLNRSNDQLRPNLDQPLGVELLGPVDHQKIQALGLNRSGPGAWVEGSSVLITSGLSFENAVSKQALGAETQDLTLEGSLSLKAGDLLWLNDGDDGVLASVKAVQPLSHAASSLLVTLSHSLGVALRAGALAQRFLWRAYYLGLGESGEGEGFDLYLQDQTGQRSALFSGLSHFELQHEQGLIKLQYSFLGGELRTIYEPTS